MHLYLASSQRVLDALLCVGTGLAADSVVSMRCDYIMSSVSSTHPRDLVVPFWRPMGLIAAPLVAAAMRADGNHCIPPLHSLVYQCHDLWGACNTPICRSQ